MRGRQHITPRRDASTAVRALALCAALGLALAGAARADFAAGWAAYQASDHAAARQSWLPLARRGDVDALYNVAALYENGLGVARDPARAAEWYARAAERGLAQAQFALGLAYETGSGVTANDGEAAVWYRRAADQNLARAQYNLGRLHYEGLGVPKDLALAAEWYQRAARTGFARAQNNLGYMHERGIHLRASAKEAAAWYRKAAKQGLATAQTNLGIMLNFGLGVARDDAEAARWYRVAARQGDAEAQSRLAFLLANGQGVERDLVEAYAWLTLAVEGAAATTGEHRARLAARLDPYQLAAAERRAADLRQQLAATKEPPRRALPRQTAKFGNARVTAQRRLATLGLYGGVVDGVFGPETTAAVRAFQGQAGLEADGRVSSKLVRALGAAVRAPRTAPQPAAETDAD